MSEQTGIVKLLENQEFCNKLQRVMPLGGIGIELFRGIVYNCIRRTPELLNCSEDSWRNALNRLAELGLRADGIQSYLIPYNNNQTRTLDVQVIVSYLGLEYLLLRSGEVLKVHSANVHENDDFQHNRGIVVRHSYPLSNRGNYVGSFCQIEWCSGAITAEIMTAEEVEAIRRNSPGFSKPNGAHQRFPNEMRRKTAIRRAMKHAMALSSKIPLAQDDDDAIDIESKVEPKRSRTVALGQNILSNKVTDDVPEDFKPLSGGYDGSRHTQTVEVKASPEEVSHYVSSNLDPVTKRAPGRQPKVPPDPFEVATTKADDIPKKIRSKLTLAGLTEAQFLDYLRSAGMEESLASLEELAENQPASLGALWTEIDVKVKAALEFIKTA